MKLTVRHLTTIGCQASGLISDQDLVKSGGLAVFVPAVLGHWCPPSGQSAYPVLCAAG